MNVLLTCLNFCRGLLMKNLLMLAFTCSQISQKQKRRNAVIVGSRAIYLDIRSTAEEKKSLKDASTRGQKRGGGRGLNQRACD